MARNERTIEKDYEYLLPTGKSVKCHYTAFYSYSKSLDHWEYYGDVSSTGYTSRFSILKPGDEVDGCKVGQEILEEIIGMKLDTKEPVQQTLL